MPISRVPRYIEIMKDDKQFSMNVSIATHTRKDNQPFPNRNHAEYFEPTLLNYI